MEPKPGTILVFAEPLIDDEYLGRSDGRRPTKVDITTLEINIKEFLVAVENVIPDTKKDIKGFHLTEIHVGAEVNGQGQVGLMGTGFTAGANASLTFVLKRE
jgi:hypothetical protein